MKREDLQRGFEPDSSFCVQNAPRMRPVRELDLNQDPPPDLSIEVDVTSQSINRVPIFAAVGIPEVWHYSLGGAVQIMKLNSSGAYETAARSLAFPIVTSEDLTRFLLESESKPSNVWARELRGWIRAQAR